MYEPEVVLLRASRKISDAGIAKVYAGMVSYRWGIFAAN